MELASQRLVFLAQLLAFERAGDGQAELIEFERFRDVVVGAELHRFDRGVGRRERRQHEDSCPRRALLDGTEHGESVDAAHSEIGEDEIEHGGLEGLERCFAAVGHGHVVAFPAQRNLQHLSHTQLVVDDENFGFSHGAPGSAG